MVNRLWQHHFGVGIVATPSDFGVMGEAPTHPELLDWLAVEFVESGWSLKHVQRLMVLSAAYRQDSGADPDDPRCARRWKWIATTISSGATAGGGWRAKRSATPCCPSAAS